MEENFNQDNRNGTNLIGRVILCVFMAMVIHFVALTIGSIISMIIYMVKDMSDKTLIIETGKNSFDFIYAGTQMSTYEFSLFYATKTSALGTAIGTPLVVGGLLLFCKIIKEKFTQSAGISANKENKNVIGRIILGLLAGITIYLPVALIVSNSFIGQMSQDKTSILDNMYTLTPTWLLILSVAICAPIIEELTFRGIVQNKLSAVCNPYAAIIIQALLFGAFHMNWQQFFYASMIGLIFGFVKHWTNSIWPTIFAHIGFNLISIVIEKIAGNSTGFSEFIDKNLVFMAVASLLVFAAVLYIIERGGKKDSQNWTKT